MAQQLPCDSDGLCMICKQKPPIIESLPCKTCTTPWHVPCLPLPPITLFDWECPDCSLPQQNNPVTITVVDPSAPPLAGDLVSSICAIQSDTSLTEQEKAKKRQELVGGSAKPPSDNDRKNDMQFNPEKKRSVAAKGNATTTSPSDKNVKTFVAETTQVPELAPSHLAPRSTWTRRKVCVTRPPRWKRLQMMQEKQEEDEEEEEIQVPIEPLSKDAPPAKKRK